MRSASRFGPTCDLVISETQYPKRFDTSRLREPRSDLLRILNPIQPFDQSHPRGSGHESCIIQPEAVAPRDRPNILSEPVDQVVPSVLATVRCREYQRSR